MNVFPKCMTNRAPYITYDGYVLPCCWVPYSKTLHFTNGEIKPNPFVREDFNLYNNKFKDILGSDAWNNMLTNIITDTPNKCKEKCSKFLVTNGFVEPQNFNVPKFNPNETDKKTFTSQVSEDPNVFLKSAEHFKNKQDKLQLETTSRCNLKCPACSRTKEAGKGTYKKGDLSLDIIEDVLTSRRWRKVDDSGRYGDPIFYKHYHEMLDIIVKSNIKRYVVHIAATGRSKDWWNTTINKFKTIQASGTGVQILFGIDGLEDTSSIYRVNQDWNEITTAMRLAKEAGMEVTWQFIPFKQNEHQIDEVKQLAKEWGVELLFVMSNRFSGLDDPMIPTNSNLHNYK